MNSKPSTDAFIDCFSCDSTVTTEQTGNFGNAALGAWLTTVVLVLIVICAALSLGAWREHKKKSETVGVQMTTIN
jgi:hypothetical protein